MRWISLAVLATGVLAGCASSSRERLGDIEFRAYGNPTAFPSVYSVQKGRIVNPNVDVVLEKNGCISGTVIRGVIDVCSKKPPPPLNPGDHVETWSGNGGNFTVELLEGGKDMRMDGFL